MPSKSSASSTLRLHSINLVLAISISFSVNTQADWLERIKSEINNVVDQTIDEVTEQKESQQVKIEDSVKNSPDKPASTSYRAPAAETTQTYSDDAAKLIDLDEAPAGSPSVLDIPLKGIRLGMPARTAHDILTKAGFGYLSYADQYMMEVHNINGQIGNYQQEDLRNLSTAQKSHMIKRYIVKFLAYEVSDEMLSEMDAQRQTMIQQARATAEKEKAQQTQAATDRMSRRRDRSGNSNQTFNRFAGQPVKLIYYIEYKQFFGNTQSFDYKTALDQARQTFGEPNYNPKSNHARQGAAYQTSPENNLVYADVLLTSAAEKEAMVQRADPKQHYVMKQGFSHPCSGIMRGRCVNGAHPASAFPGNLELQLKLARLQGAPFMLVSPETSKGMKIIQEWQYLLGGDTVRKAFRQKNAEAAKPKASVDF